jgi:hypothetical protein
VHANCPLYPQCSSIEFGGNIRHTRGVGVFIHFYPDADVLCDGCDQIGAIVSLSARRENHLKLCSTCFRTVTHILNLASTKLRLE